VTVLLLVVTNFMLQLALVYLLRGVQVAIVCGIAGLMAAVVGMAALYVGTLPVLISAAILIIFGMVFLFRYSSKYGKPPQKQ
jgi:uncharacterized membrane protein YhaH (DUF805 family)